MHQNKRWFEVTDTSEIISPALLVYPDRIIENIKKMIDMVIPIFIRCTNLIFHKFSGIVFIIGFQTNKVY